MALFLITLCLVLSRPASAQEGDFTLLVTAEDGRAAVALGEASSPPSTLSGNVLFDSEILGSTTCRVLVALGACNDLGGQVSFAMVAASPWPAGIDLVEITFANARFDGPAELHLSEISATTLQGDQLYGLTVDGLLESQPSSWPTTGAWIVVGIVAVILAGSVARRIRATSLTRRVES